MPARARSATRPRNLVNALRSSPKARGRWGEQSLRTCSNRPACRPCAISSTEVSVDTDDGRLRPDVIVRLPGGRKLIIDAKCSLNAFLDASEEVDDDKRDGLHLQRACRLDPQPCPAARLQELLGAVRRRRRLCRHVHSRRAFPDRRARAGRRCGNGRSSAACCSRRRPTSSPSRAPSQASGGRRSSPRKRPRSPSSARSSTRGWRRWRSMSRRSAATSARQRRLQRVRRQPGKPGADPGAQVRGSRSRQRQGDSGSADGRGRARVR